MRAAVLTEKIKSLPLDMRQGADRFIDFLLTKTNAVRKLKPAPKKTSGGIRSLFGILLPTATLEQAKEARTKNACKSRR